MHAGAVIPSASFSENEFTPKVSIEKGRANGAITMKRTDLNVTFSKHLGNIRMSLIGSIALLFISLAASVLECLGFLSLESATNPMI